MVKPKKPFSFKGNAEGSDANDVEWEEHVNERLLASPMSEEMFIPMGPTAGLVLLNNTVHGSLFVTENTCAGPSGKTAMSQTNCHL